MNSATGGSLVTLNADESDGKTETTRRPTGACNVFLSCVCVSVSITFCAHVTGVDLKHGFILRVLLLQQLILNKTSNMFQSF
jgi:hypothetical protein